MYSNLKEIGAETTCLREICYPIAASWAFDSIRALRQRRLHAILSSYVGGRSPVRTCKIRDIYETASGGKILDKKYVNYARDIVIKHSKDYKLYLNQYVADGKKTGGVLDYTPYLESTMEGIFYASINEAMWKPFADSDSEEASVKLIDRICELKAHLDDTGAKAGRNLHTPTYAAILIAVAMKGETLGDGDTQDLYALDKSVKSYFAMAAKNQQTQKEKNA